MKPPITYKGKSYASWKSLAIAYGLKPASLYRRLQIGESLEEAITALRPIELAGQQFSNLTAVAVWVGIPYATLKRRLKKLNLPLDQAVSLPIKKLKRGSVKAFGQTYSSFAVAARAYGLNPDATRQRLNAGMTVEEALTFPSQRSKSIRVFGEQYASISALAQRYKIPLQTLRSRLRQQWTPEDAVTRRIVENRQNEIDGQQFASIAELARHFKKDYKFVYKRIYQFGWSPKEAVERPKNIGTEIRLNNVSYPTIAKAAIATGVPPGLASYRLNAGWTVERAFDPTAPVDNRKSITIDGEFFATFSAAARTFNIKETTLMKRLRTGWTPEQAAGLSKAPEYSKGQPPVSPKEYKKRLTSIHGDTLDFSHAIFGKAQQKIEVYCKLSNPHPPFWATPNNLLKGTGCPICKLSLHAKRTARWLEQRDLLYETEWTGHGLRSKTYTRAVLRYDFRLLDHQVLIECDGLQHFEPCTLGKMTDDEAKHAFQTTKNNDKRKNKWATENNYMLIRIRYDELPSEVLNKRLIETGIIAS